MKIYYRTSDARVSSIEESKRTKKQKSVEQNTDFAEISANIMRITGVAQSFKVSKVVTIW